MTARATTTGSTAANLGPTGPPATGTGKQYISSPWRPASSPSLAEPDTLMLVQPTDEAQVLAQNGRLHVSTQAYFAQTRAVLTTGPFVAKAFPVDADGSTHALYCVDGAFPLDEFTLEFWAKSKAADFTAQSTNGKPLLSVFENSPNGGTKLLISVDPTVGHVNARFLIDNSNGPQALMTLSLGDWPADTWKCFSITLKSGTMTVMLGDNVRSGSIGSVTTTARPWGSLGNGNAGVIPNADSGTASGPYEVGEVHIRRFARTYNTELSYKGPTVSVNASSSSGAFPTNLFGVFAQYPGWRDSLPDGQTGGGGPGLTGTAVRDALIAAETAAGMKLVRVDHALDKATITGSYPSYTYDWSSTDGPMDALSAAGCKFHLTLGFCPSPLRGGGGINAVPSDNTSFAQICSDYLLHIKTRYGASKVSSIALWNEPESGSFWAGNTTQYTTMWAAVQSKLAADHPDLPALGGPDTAAGVAATSYQKALIDYAGANSKPVGCICTHQYSESPGVIYAEVAAIRAYLSTAGVANAATVPIGLTEWNLASATGNQRHDTGGTSVASLAKYRDKFRDEWLAAYAFAALYELQSAGGSFAVFTRMGILDDFFTQIERDLGLFTHDNPPRPLPVYATFQALWKLQGNRITATSNFPYLRAFAAKATSGKIVAVYGNYRPHDGKASLPLSIEWTGLPSTYTWKQYRMDSRDTADGRLHLLASGDQTNPPIGADVQAMGVGCIEITPPTAS